MQIKTKKDFREIVKNLALEFVDSDELDEATTTDCIDGYNTPFAFGDKSTSSKKKKKTIATNSTGYKVVREGIDDKDIKVIKTLIRDVVSDILRDIWLKRSAWKKGTK